MVERPLLRPLRSLLAPRLLALTITLTLGAVALAAPPEVAPDDAQRGAQERRRPRPRGTRSHHGSRHHRGQEAPPAQGVVPTPPPAGTQPVPAPRDPRDPLIPLPF